MRILLDTNIAIMLIEDESRLTLAYLSLLANPENDFLLSAVSLWEIAIKQRKGKLQLGFAVVDLQPMLKRAEINVLPLDGRHAIADADLPPDLKDPFDRLILAIAELEGIPLLTTDTKLLEHPRAWRP